MRRFLLAVAVAILFVFAGKFVAYVILRDSFSLLSYDIGFFLAILMYIVTEWILQTKDKIKTGAIADIKIVVKDATDPEQVADAVSTGIKTFDAFKKLGISVKYPDSVDENEGTDDGSDYEKSEQESQV